MSNTIWLLTWGWLSRWSLCHQNGTPRSSQTQPANVCRIFELFKALDTVIHSMMLKLLEWYVARPKLRYAIARMYADPEIVLK